MVLTSLLLVALVSFTSGSSPQQCKAKYSDYGYTLLESSYKTFFIDNLGMCYDKCTEDERCMSINYNIGTGHCDHNNVTKTGFPSKLKEKENSVYADHIEPEYGTTPELALESCKRVKETNPDAPSGHYWINVNSSNEHPLPMKVYCDMTTDGGGWTLVYSYRFTNYANFKSSSNAVTPVPTWPINPASSPKSKTTPLDELSYLAMDFILWKKIGNEFMIKSNLTHWIGCTSGTGDLVNWRQGTINCRVIKNIGNACLNVAPTDIILVPYCGVGLMKSGDYVFYFEGDSVRCYPVHDPCGKRNSINLPPNVATPSGAMFIR